ncbi:MAG: hypothetical protein WD941_01665 [Opitutus sp.]
MLAPAALFAQNVTTSGTFSVGGGTALLDGDRPAFQQITQHRKTWYGGIEEFHLVREGDESVLKFDARLLPWDDNFRIAVRYEVPEKFYFDAGFDQFRVYSDGSSARYPAGQSFVMFEEDLRLTRGKIWAEFGAFTANQTLIKLRYERRMRDGSKASTMWADTNLAGGTRSFVPSFYDLDETTDIVSLDVGNDSKEEMKWNVGMRFQEATLDNKRWARRRPFESADRQITTKDETKTDIFTVHGYYLRKVSEQLTVSGGALRTSLDSRMAGSRIYGQSYDPVYDPSYARKQQRDEGFYGLGGSADVEQTVLNLNAVYLPKKNWTVRGAIRYENRHNETMAEFIETNVVGSALVSEGHDMVSLHDRKWDEFAESIEARYTGVEDWTFGAKAEWVQGSGDLDEEFYNHHTHEVTTDRKSDDVRKTQKYSLNANWYAQPGLTFAAQYYFKGQQNDYDAVRDNTYNGPETTGVSGNRYPSYLTNQDFEVHDLNLRMSWRPAAGLNLVTRYDYQTSEIYTQAPGLALVTSGTLDSHIISQSVTWSPTARLYLNGAINVTKDSLETPAIPGSYLQNGDNDYLNLTLGGGYAIGKKDNVQVDVNYFKADNFVSTTATMPLNSGQDTRAGYLTWVRRQSETLAYTVKYGYITNDDEANRGLNDFNAHVLYAKVQFSF